MGVRGRGGAGSAAAMAAAAAAEAAAAAAALRSRAGTTLVLDNGAGFVKAGLAVAEDEEGAGTADEDEDALDDAARARRGLAVRVVPNCVVRSRNGKLRFVGDELDACRDVSGLVYRRPHDRGYLVGFATQREVWVRALSGGRGGGVNGAPACAGLGVSTTECRNLSVLVTEAPFCPPSLAARQAAFLLDPADAGGFGFRDACVVPPALLALRHASAVCDQAENVLPDFGVVLDVGFSFATAVPVVRGRVFLAGVRRLSIGGKQLTNLLKEQVSYRSVNMMDETYVVDEMKEAACFVSATGMRAELQAAAAEATTAGRKRARAEGWPTLRREYVLPDGVEVVHGRVRGEDEARQREEEAKGMGRKERAAFEAQDQTVWLSLEQVSVPEALFHPRDLGIEQGGVHECIKQAVEACPEEVRPALYQNVVITGGSSLFVGFVPRLERELRSIVPDIYGLSVFAFDDEDAKTAAFYGGQNLVLGLTPEERAACFATREEYVEEGVEFCLTKWRRAFYDCPELEAYLEAAGTAAPAVGPTSKHAS